MHGVLYPGAENAGIKSAQARCVGVTGMRLIQGIFLRMLHLCCGNPRCEDLL